MGHLNVQNTNNHTLGQGVVTHLLLTTLSKLNLSDCKTRGKEVHIFGPQHIPPFFFINFNRAWTSDTGQSALDLHFPVYHTYPFLVHAFQSCMPLS